MATLAISPLVPVKGPLTESLTTVRSRVLLAPAFDRALSATLSEMRQLGHDPYVFETIRGDARQRALYKTGVSKAKSGWSSWHFFGLAADVISISKGWDDEKFFADLARVAEGNGLASGLNWPTFHDAPHLQWGRCKRSPSILSRTYYLAAGVPRVWQAVGAL